MYLTTDVCTELTPLTRNRSAPELLSNKWSQKGCDESSAGSKLHRMLLAGFVADEAGVGLRADFASDDLGEEAFFFFFFN